MRYFNLTLLLILGTGVFCFSQKGSLVIDIDKALSVSSQPVMLSSIASSVEYIPLETNDSVLIGGVISQVYLTRNYILVTDESHTPYLFDRSGKFLSRLGSRGKGPGEMSGLVSSVYVEDQTGRISVFSSGKLYLFNTEGALLEEIPLTERVFGEPVYSVQYGGNDKNLIYFQYTIGSGSPVYQIKTSDQEGYHSSVLPVNIGVKETVSPSNDPHVPDSRSYNLTVFFMPDHVCIFDEIGRIVTEMNFDGTIKEQYVVKNSSRNKNGSEIFIGNMVSTPRYHFLRILSDKSSFTLFDKKKNRTIILPAQTGGLINDVDDGPNFWCVAYSTEGEYVSFMPAHRFIQSSQESDNPELKSIAATLKEDDNLVLMIASSK